MLMATVPKSRRAAIPQKTGSSEAAWLEGWEQGNAKRARNNAAAGVPNPPPNSG
jgi:hypothetical protein